MPAPWMLSAFGAFAMASVGASGGTKARKPMKYVVVTGGVVSGLGKGISISSLGLLLKLSGVRVTSIKIDPYLNVDAGTMSPFEHGEVFVLDDGGEADLDLGNYERFLGTTLTREHNITTGKVYMRVIEAERRGDYLGKTVQVVPHVTNEIMDWIERVAQIPVDSTGEPADVCMIEVGGTIGDIESLVFIEALRQLQFRVDPENMMFFHVSLVPEIHGEQKTKPTQHSTRELRTIGINPDGIICRSPSKLQKSARAKLAQFCQVPKEHVFAVHDVSNIYHVPLILQEQGATAAIFSRLKIIPACQPQLGHWRAFAVAVDKRSREVVIAMVGKYTGQPDAYLSVIKSLKHASVAADVSLVIDWVDASALEPAMSTKDHAKYERAWASVRAANGILVPGGFGNRGIEGMILAINYARLNNVPFFGICLGLQCAVIEYARNILSIKEATSGEFDPQGNPDNHVVVFMPEIDRFHLGGTMRLGARETLLDSSSSLAFALYGKRNFKERHRHRYEVNPRYVEQLRNAGLRFSGTDEKLERMEVLELDQSTHPFFFAVQFHPEFLSHPNKPVPSFMGFMLASSGTLVGAVARAADTNCTGFTASLAGNLPLNMSKFDLTPLEATEAEIAISAASSAAAGGVAATPAPTVTVGTTVVVDAPLRVPATPPRPVVSEHLASPTTPKLRSGAIPVFSLDSQTSESSGADSAIEPPKIVRGSVGEILPVEPRHY